MTIIITRERETRPVKRLLTTWPPLPLKWPQWYNTLSVSGRVHGDVRAFVDTHQSLRTRQRHSHKSCVRRICRLNSLSQCSLRMSRYEMQNGRQSRPFCTHHRRTTLQSKTTTAVRSSSPARSQAILTPRWTAQVTYTRQLSSERTRRSERHINIASNHIASTRSGDSGEKRQYSCSIEYGLDRHTDKQSNRQ